MKHTLVTVAIAIGLVALFQSRSQSDTEAKDYQIEEFGPDQLKPYFERAATVVNASLTPGPLDEASEILRRGGEMMGWNVSQLELAQRR